MDVRAVIVAVVLAGCGGSASEGSDAGAADTTTMPDGAPCASGTLASDDVAMFSGLWQRRACQDGTPACTRLLQQDTVLMADETSFGLGAGVCPSPAAASQARADFCVWRSLAVAEGLSPQDLPQNPCGHP